MGKKNRGSAAPFKKNDIIDMTVTAMSSEGNGIAKPRNFTVFIPLTDIGDVVRVRILKVLKSFAYGKAEKLITPSESRIVNHCPAYSKCGGCCFRHISYAHELEIKRQHVVDAVNRIGGFEGIPIKPIIGSEKTDSYRNKCLLPVGTDSGGNSIIGFYALNSHRIIDIDNCMLQPKVFSKITKIFRSWLNEKNIPVYNEETHTGLIRRLYLRLAETTGEIMVCIVAKGNSLPYHKELASELSDKIPGFKSLILNINPDKTNVALGEKSITLYGSDTITDTLCGLSFDISPTSFYQVNRSQAEKLYEIAKEYAALKSTDTLIDLYCGTGTIGLSMVKNGGKLIGVEIVEAAVQNAIKNAEKNGIENAEFICADAFEASKKIKSRGITPDVIVIDPPRKGTTPDTIETISKLSPKRVVYVSCDPATLARDLKIFSELGYEPQEITPVDMFPRTSHVECVCLMSKSD